MEKGQPEQPSEKPTQEELRLRAEQAMAERAEFLRNFKPAGEGISEEEQRQINEINRRALEAQADYNETRFPSIEDPYRDS